jgi:hypothetical protein
MTYRSAHPVCSRPSQITHETLPLSWEPLCVAALQNKLPWIPDQGKYKSSQLEQETTYRARRIWFLTMNLRKQTLQLRLESFFLCSLVEFAEEMTTSLECVVRERQGGHTQVLFT